MTPIRAAASHLDETGLLLPTPAIVGGKEVPPTMYTSKTFQRGGALTSRTIHLDRTVSPTKDDDGGEGDADEVAPHGEDGGGGLHLPSGQHLLIDIKHVDPDFLNSEERLAAAMIEMVNESKLTLLSYHCHSLVPVGVSCAGVLLESHVSCCCHRIILYLLCICDGQSLTVKIPRPQHNAGGIPHVAEGRGHHHGPVHLRRRTVGPRCPHDH